MASKRLFSALAALSLLGVGLSAWLSKIFYDIRIGAAGFQSACNFGEKMNCDAVAASSYAEFISGVPLSSVAAGWFLATLVVALIGRNLYWRREAARAALVLTGVSVMTSAFYFWVMTWQIRTYCLFCLLIEATSLVSFVLVLKMKPEGFREHKPEMARWKVLGGSALASFVIGILALTAFKHESVGDDRRLAEVMNQIMAESPLPVEGAIESMAIGPKNARVVITEFIDFQCPACRAGAQILNALLHRYPNEVRLVVRNYPLDPSCNPAMKHAGHVAACEAARVAVCASQQGKLKQAYQALFESQPELGPGVPTRIISSLEGIDATALQSCVDSQETQQIVSRDLRDGEQLQLRGTPSFFVNGRRMPGLQPLDVWDEIVKSVPAET